MYSQEEINTIMCYLRSIKSSNHLIQYNINDEYKVIQHSKNIDTAIDSINNILFKINKK